MPLSRTNMALAIPPDKQFEVIANIYEDSALLQLADVRQMTSAVQDVVTSGAFTWPTTNATGVKGMAIDEAAAKQETTSALASYQLVANKLATFVIVSDELLAESAFDLIAFYQDAITQRMAFLIDSAGLQGGTLNNPFGSENVAAAATAAGGGHVQVIAGTLASTTYAVDKLTAMFNAVEGDDYLPNGWLIQRSVKGNLRNLTQTTGVPLLSESFQTDIPDSIWGEPAYFLGRGVFPTVAASSLRGVIGDFSQYVVGIRDELSFSLHSEGTIGSVNLLETNQVALRAEMRLGAKVIDNKAFARLNSPAS